MLLMTLFAGTLLAAPVGQRPYELDWAGRTEDDHPALVDFEQDNDWQVETVHSAARFERSREQQLFGQWVGKLTYRGQGQGAPVVLLKPPQPMPVATPFDAVTLWVYGNNWGWAPSPSTPQVGVSVDLLDAKGQPFNVPLWSVDFGQWNLLHKRLSPEQIERVKDGASFAAIRVERGTNTEDRFIYVDSLCFYREALAPLAIAPRAKRGVDPFPGQDAGQNTGPGRLPFPTRAETILPPAGSPSAAAPAPQPLPDGRFEFKAANGQGSWTVTTQADGFAAVSAHWNGGQSIQFGVGGGVVLTDDQQPATGHLIGSSLADDVLTTRWELTAGGRTCEATYRYRLWGNTLVLSVEVPGGEVREVRYGRVTGLVNPKLIQIPYYVYSPGRPMVVASGTPNHPLLVAGNTDWYLSNASEVFGESGIDEQGVLFNGGTRYLPKTDGQRNPVFERFFLSVSRDFDEVLPTVANPPSPWKSVTGTGVWLAHGASNRDNDSAYFRECKARGFDKLIITDHETMWRDDGESFTFRTRTAPGRGGDESAERYSRLLNDELGYVYGPYNNYTDFAPVNEYWDTDRVVRLPDGQLQHAWMRCYAPKPTWAVGMCEQLAPEIQRKFGFRTAYCDVHTAIPPWQRTDYDARVPGAGTFAQTLYAWGELLLLQRQAWQGPVYSEGNHHVFLHGLTDGNYAQDQSARLPERPWLVDFDLRRLHDLGCNFGMGNPDMFYGGGAKAAVSANPLARIDRFLAATIAFGHPGFFVNAGWPDAMRSYFMVQALASRYTQVSVRSIEYLDESGEGQTAAQAALSGALERRQLRVTYTDGTQVIVNGNETERLRLRRAGEEIDLPPLGYQAWTPDDVSIFSGDVEGHRVDYAASPDYVYFDGRGEYRRMPRAAGNGPGSAVRRDGGWLVRLEGGSDCGFDLPGAASAKALAQDGSVIGPAELRRSRGLCWIQPVDGAFTYQVSTKDEAKGDGLNAERYLVTPGETVQLDGAPQASWTVPVDAKPGSHLWQQFGNLWLDFVVVPSASVTATLEGDTANVVVSSALAKPTEATVSWLDQTRQLRLDPGRAETASFALPQPTVERTIEAPVVVQMGAASVRRDYALQSLRSPLPGPPLPTDLTMGVQLRGQPETRSPQAILRCGARCEPTETQSCGTTHTRGPGETMLFMHPPWQGGVGLVYGLTQPITLPIGTAVRLVGEVGKSDGSDLGDGIWFKVAVVDAEGTETQIAEQVVTRHEWLPLRADLAQWRGQTVQLKLIADVGPNNDSSGDWSVWSGLKLQSAEDGLRWRLSDDAALATAQAPGGSVLVAAALLPTAVSGKLHFEAVGLESSQAYHNSADLNGVAVGILPATGGDEAKGVYSSAELDLPPAVLASLGAHNELALINHEGDSFNVRRPWLEVTLQDGRVVRSRVSTATYTQPPGWRYAEGIQVPLGQSIHYDLWFDVAPD